MLIRLCKVVMVLGLAAFAFLVTFNNLTDYQSNYMFVERVLSMDTTFEGNAGMWRAITSPAVHTAGYWLIIAGEGLTFLLLLAGGLRLAAALRAPAPAFERAKDVAVAGCTMGFLVWFVGFIVVGGEWFLMWQSTTWNGQQAAFRFVVCILAVLIFLNQHERD